MPRGKKAAEESSKQASSRKKSGSSARPPKLTPMLRQYLEVKAQHEDAILFYRMGDFYELFFDDAERAAPVMEVTLTARNKGSENEAPMCGVPHHSVDSYIGKLLKAGLRVAICDQVEDPAQAKGLVKREVTRVVTPGTVSEPSLLEGKEENHLASVVWNGEQGAGAFLDISTGSFFVRRWESVEECIEDLRLMRPREALYEAEGVPEAIRRHLEGEIVCVTALEGDRLYDRKRAAELLQRQLDTTTLRGFGLEEKEPAVRAAAAALAYAQETQHSDLSHIQSLALRESGEALVIDSTTLANLEVFRSLREGGRKGTLLSVLDRTVTAPGGRTLRGWLRRPLRDPAAIGQRHEAVGELVQQGEVRQRLRELLARVSDPERLLTRAVLGTLAPRETAALRDSLELQPELLALAAECESPLLAELGATDPLQDLHAELARVLEEAPATQLKDGGVIAEGVDEELDRHRSLARDSKRHILELEANERKSTGISSLKIRYNKVFGYYVEVTKANQHLVPEHYIRKQTLVNAERYITPEIKELEEQILGAEEKQLALEAEHYAALVARVAQAGAGLSRLAAALGRLDALTAFAEVAVKGRYRRPTMLPLGEPITVREGRHPVVEQTSTDPFVPNDVELDGEEAQIVLLTGPNMGGKSTYLRQVALLVLMAQAGSFVPAEEATLGVVDRIFTRVGASDDLARGESTFMVEMIETANILHHASAHSLVILDEVGRGTATFDGLSLAWAIVEYLHRETGCKTLFATHYHELTELAAVLPRLVNRTLSVKEWGERIIFLRRVVPGAADKSYGIQVARLAGLPEDVTRRASEVLANLESQEYDFSGKPRLAQGEHAPPEATSKPPQMPLFTPPEEVVAGLLREVDLDELTPLAALNLLQSLKDRLR
ncbi:MAG: DNA mismatch repair protein MutS [Acidobacteriota bacterium]|nr:DNA mismatch repair protein MutS [Acidobacteriota bacterium]